MQWYAGVVGATGEVKGIQMRLPDLRGTACIARVYGRLQWFMQTRLPCAEHRNRVGPGR